MLPSVSDDAVAIAHDGPSGPDFTEMINSNTAQQQQLGLNLMPAASSQSCSTSSVSLMSELPPASINIPPFIPMPFSNTHVAGACLNTRSSSLANQTPALSDVGFTSATPFPSNAMATPPHPPVGMVTHPRMPSVSTNMSSMPAMNIQQGVRSHWRDAFMMQLRQQPVKSRLMPDHPQHMQQHIGIGMNPMMTRRSEGKPLLPSICTSMYTPYNQIQCTMMSKQATTHMHQMEPHHQIQHPALNTVGKTPVRQQMQGPIMGPQYQSVTPSGRHGQVKSNQNTSVLLSHSHPSSPQIPSLQAMQLATCTHNATTITQQNTLSAGSQSVVSVQT